MNLSPVTRPVLRYYGGKWKLAPWIISHFPTHRTYIEPFGGAGSVLIRKPRSYAEIYNDLDGEIVNLFRVLRDPEQANQLTNMLRLTPFARDEYALSYEMSDDPIEQARRTVARSYMGFGTNSINRSIATGFRGNSNRTHTTPAHDWAHFPDCISTMVDRLAGVVIENRDAKDVIQQHDSAEALIYADPPYVHSTRGRQQRKNYFSEMDDNDHRELADLLHQVRGVVILSGYRCDLYDDLYSDWTRIDKATTADGAQPRIESLWISKVKHQLVMHFQDEQ